MNNIIVLKCFAVVVGLAIMIVGAHISRSSIHSMESATLRGFKSLERTSLWVCVFGCVVIVGGFVTIVLTLFR